MSGAITGGNGPGTGGGGGGGGGVSASGTPASGQLARWTSNSAIQGLTLGTGVATALTTAASGTGAFILGTGSTIDNAVIGSTTPNTGSFTTLSYTTALQQSGVQVMYHGSTAFGSGTQSIGIGAFAGGSSLSTASLNTFVGFAAGQSNSTGGENTFLGTLAGQFHTTGTYNTALGQHAMGYDIAPLGCTHVGNDNARNRVTQASNGFNTSVGKSGMSYGSGYNHTSIGASAFQGNTSYLALGGTPVAGDTIQLIWTGTFTGSPYTFTYTVPASPTLASVTSGLSAAINADSTLVHLNNGAGLTGVTDSSNVQVYLAGTSTTGVAVTIAPTVTTTGSLTCANFGGEAGYGNVAIGYQAMQGLYITSGNQNIAIGQQTLYRLTTGGNNIALGYQSLNALTTSTYNTCLGYQSGLGITSGSRNQAIGQLTLGNVTTGAYHIAIGDLALSAATITANSVANANVAIGPNSLKGVSGSSFYSNVGVGASTGVAVTTGHQNTLIGSNSSTILTTGSNNTLIGFAVASTTLQTGGFNILIGVDSSTDTAAAGTANTVLIKGQSGGVAVLSSVNCNATPTTIFGGYIGVVPTTGLTAHAGGGQASALLLAAGFNLLATVATAGDSVKLPVFVTAGMSITIANNGANAAQVFGSGTDTINGVASGTGVSLPAGKTATYWCPASGTWFGGYLN